MDIRVGQGFDVHPFVDDPDRLLVLGGVRFDGARGAAGSQRRRRGRARLRRRAPRRRGPGRHRRVLPRHRPRVRAGADSIDLLGQVADLIRAEGWTPGNVDCSVVTEPPKLAPRRGEMQARLADAVGAPVSSRAGGRRGWARSAAPRAWRAGPSR